MLVISQSKPNLGFIFFLPLEYSRLSFSSRHHTNVMSSNLYLENKSRNKFTMYRLSLVTTSMYCGNTAIDGNSQNSFRFHFVQPSAYLFVLDFASLYIQPYFKILVIMHSSFGQFCLLGDSSSSYLDILMLWKMRTHSFDKLFSQSPLHT